MTPRIQLPVVALLGLLAAPFAPAQDLEWKKPAALKPGDTIAFVAPAAPVDLPRMQEYAKQLEAAGYKVRITPGVEKRKQGYLAGSDYERETELNKALRDPAVRGVFAARGGYGLTRIIDELDYDALRKDPKVVTGYSDLTALHLAIAAKAKVVTFHSPMVLSNLDRADEKNAFANDAFRRAVFADRYPKGEVGYPVPVPADGPKPVKLVGGTARGRLLGGNLTLVCSTLGTPYAIQPKGAILFIEDVDEAPYRVDRYLSQLKLAGVLDQVAGVVAGQFTHEKGGKPTDAADTERVLREYLGQLNVPVVLNFPLGHVPQNTTLPHGGMAELDADKLTLRLTENPVEVSASPPAESANGGPPAVSARAWAIADGKTGQFLWGGNEAEKRPMASTTKIMTALLVLGLAAADPKVLDEVVTFSERAAKTPGSSAKLKVGEKVPVKDLLYGLMLPSGNDASVAFGEHFGPRFPGKPGDPPPADSTALFVAEMNRRAAALGLAGTSYQDTSGLTRNNQSTARDLAKLAWHGYKDERFRKVVGTRKYDSGVTGPDGQKRAVTWNNTNELLGSDGFDGVKTGTTGPAGACLVASGRKEGDHLFLVILGSTASKDRYKDARALFDWAWQKRGHKPDPKADAGGAAKPLAGAVIVVDPGHGGQGYSRSYTGGTRGVNSKLTESELNLRVGFELARQLTEQGATVHMTRTANHRLSREGSSKGDELHARVDFFDHHNPHFFLSVHHNAGRPGGGHTALYKHNAKDDALYDAVARDVNDALEGAVPGPKLKLIKGDYHILRETDIPGTISEAGFMTDPAFDTLCNTPDYPQTEAAALVKGAVKYWSEHEPALESLRDRLAKERAARPRDPKTYTAIALNPEHRAAMGRLLVKVAPDGQYDPAKAGKYVEAFKTAAVTDPKATFDVKASFDGRQVALTGIASDRKDHDRLIDMLVAMKLYAIANDIALPKPPAPAKPKTPEAKPAAVPAGVK